MLPIRTTDEPVACQKWRVTADEGVAPGPLGFAKEAMNT
jgi:hypothetical protein